MGKIIFLFALLTMTLLTTACSRYASEKNLDGISIHMSKQEVINRMHGQGVARGAIINKHGQTIEVREYKVSDLWLPTTWELETYWLYFCDGRLVQWGKAGDWAEAQKVIYDINFKILPGG